MMMEGDFRLRRMSQAVGIHRMNHINLVASGRQCLYQAVDEHAVAPEMVGRIERGHHAKPKGPDWHHGPFPRTETPPRPPPSARKTAARPAALPVEAAAGAKGPQAAGRLPPPCPHDCLD